MSGTSGVEGGRSYLSEQYRTELFGTMICFSQVVLINQVSMQCTKYRCKKDRYTPVLQETRCHYFLVFEILLSRMRDLVAAFSGGAVGIRAF